MPIVDVHTHIYPDKIAQKATESVGLFYDIPMEAHDLHAARAAFRLAHHAQRGVLGGR